jgi:hypothetical protein
MSRRTGPDVCPGTKENANTLEQKRDAKRWLKYSLLDACLRWMCSQTPLVNAFKRAQKATRESP